MQTADMMLASTQVIQQRTVRMAQATLPLSARDNAEFTLMGAEKVEAAMEVLRSIAVSAMTHNPLNGPKLWLDISAVQSDLLRLMTSASLSQAMTRNEQLGRSIRKAASNAGRFSKQSATTALKALQPIHSRALANARRLKKTT